MKLKTFNSMTQDEKNAYNALDLGEQLNYDLKLLHQEVKAYVKEYNRLEKKYGYDGKLTVNEVYNRPFFYDDESGSLIYTGGKNMAQYDAHNHGVCPASEVKMWE